MKKLKIFPPLLTAGEKLAMLRSGKTQWDIVQEDARRERGYSDADFRKAREELKRLEAKEIIESATDLEEAEKRLEDLDREETDAKQIVNRENYEENVKEDLEENEEDNPEGYSNNTPYGGSVERVDIEKEKELTDK